MRKGVLLISLLIGLVIASSVIMLQPSSHTAYGTVQGLDTSSKFTYGPFHNLSSANSIQIPIPNGWDVTSVNTTFSNVRAPNSTISMEEDALRVNDITNFSRAMSIQLPENQSAYLYSLGFYLFYYPITPPPSYINLSISFYNAINTTIDGNTVPKPDTLLFNKTVDFPLITGPIGWKDFYADNTSEVDPEINTYNNTFFIGINASIPAAYHVFWFYAPDNAIATNAGQTYDDKGYAFNYNGSDWSFEYADSTNHTLGGIDYCLRVRFSVYNESGYWETPFPTDVNMNVNGTAVQNLSRGAGLGNLSQPLNISENMATLYVANSWFSPLIFDVTIEVSGVDVLGMLYTRSLTLLSYYNFTKDNQNNFFILLGFIALGAVVAGGYGGWTAYKKRMIPLNALKSLENILVDHNPTGVMIWSFDFISMEQDIALVSGFMSAIKSFLEEMKVGGLKRLSTEFGTFIREESQLLTATCITGDIGLDEELWIRSKLHEFLVQIEQSHYKQLEDWKGNVSQFKESFPAILASLIDLEKVQNLQRKKIDKLTRNKENLQKTVNNYGAKLENLKSRYDSGEIDFKKYILERYKIEAKYDKVQKDYLYSSLFLARTPSLLEAKPVKPKDAEKIEKIQNRFLEVRKEIEELRRKELEGSITSSDLERKESLQKELMTLMEKLDKLKKT
ncbi:MAG: hypothetical protein WED07_00835 [Candidatus Freyarchaeum deiterrae]